MGKLNVDKITSLRLSIEEVPTQKNKGNYYVNVNALAMYKDEDTERLVEFPISFGLSESDLDVSLIQVLETLMSYCRQAVEERLQLL